MDWVGRFLPLPWKGHFPPPQVAQRPHPARLFKKSMKGTSVDENAGNCMDQECKYLIPTSMESSLFLILQTLAGTGMNKLLTVNTSKSGLGDTFPSNIKLF